MGKLVSLADLAVIVGRSERSLIQDTDQGLPVQDRGVDGHASVYDTAEAITWLIARAAARVSATTEEQRRRLLAAQADRAELELKARSGELVNAKQFASGARRAASEVRESICAIPARIAPALDAANPQRARELLERELGQALRGLAFYLEGLSAADAAAARPVQTSGLVQGARAAPTSAEHGDG